MREIRGVARLPYAFERAIGVAWWTRVPVKRAEDSLATRLSTVDCIGVEGFPRKASFSWFVNITYNVPLPVGSR